VKVGVMEFKLYNVLLQTLRALPLETVEAILMRAFVVIYASDLRRDGRQPSKCGKSSNSERQAFCLLSSVCCDWHQTLVGWPQSSTQHWVRHQLKKLIKREYTTCFIVNTPTLCDLDYVWSMSLVYL